MKISDLRIGTKLGASFLAVVLFTALLGAISLVQLSRMYSKTEEIATNLLPSVAHAGEMRVLLNRMRRAEAGLATSRSKADVDAFAEQVGQRYKELERVESEYGALIDSDTEREAYDKYRKLKAEGRPTRLVACDIYRPAAIDQLETLGQQLDVPVYAERDTKDVVRIGAAWAPYRSVGSWYMWRLLD